MEKIDTKEPSHAWIYKKITRSAKIKATRRDVVMNEIVLKGEIKTRLG